MSRRVPPRNGENPYHITARTNNREWFGLDLDQVWEIFESQLFFIHHAYSIQIHSFVLMNNHFHLLVTDPKLNLSKAMRWLMTETSREIGRRTGRQNHIYGQRNYQCLIDSYHYFLHAYKYVYRNPVSAGLVRRPEDYPFSTLRGLLGFSKLMIPVQEDSLLFEDVEGTLDWLNRKPREMEWQNVRKALRKGKFQLAQEKSTNRESKLETQRL